MRTEPRLSADSPSWIWVWVSGVVGGSKLRLSDPPTLPHWRLAVLLGDVLGCVLGPQCDRLWRHCGVLFPETGHKPVVIGEMLGVTGSLVYYWHARWRKSGLKGLVI